MTLWSAIQSIFGGRTDDDAQMPLSDSFVRPGLGSPIYAWKDSKFPSAVLDEWSTIPLATRELYVLFFVEQITNKPDWHAKVFDETIVSKWRSEAEAVNWEEAVGEEHGTLSGDLFNYVSANGVALSLTIRVASDATTRRPSPS